MCDIFVGEWDKDELRRGISNCDMNVTYLVSRFKTFSTNLLYLLSAEVRFTLSSIISTLQSAGPCVSRWPRSHLKSELKCDFVGMVAPCRIYLSFWGTSNTGARHYWMLGSIVLFIVDARDYFFMWESECGMFIWSCSQTLGNKMCLSWCQRSTWVDVNGTQSVFFPFLIYG